jgi:3alpha(or 20beta)-hydroxysteroid dehydrogenase
MSTPLKGRVALVTGAAHGIGAATVRLLADRGAAVVATDVLDDEGEALASELTAVGHAVTYHHLDVANESAWATVIGQTLTDRGRLDVLVNNAGIGTLSDCGGDRGRLGSAHRHQPARRVAQDAAAVPEFRKVGAARSSTSAPFWGSRASADRSPTTSKGAVRLMTVGDSLRQGRIRVNSVHRSSTPRWWPR